MLHIETARLPCTAWCASWMSFFTTGFTLDHLASETGTDALK